MADVQKLIGDILSGGYEGDEGEIIAAIRKRQEAGAIRFCWRIEWDGLDFTEDNLTVAEAKMVEKRLGRSIYLSPPARSAENLSAYLVAALVYRRDMEEQAAADELGKAPIKALLQSISDYTEVQPPKDSGDQTSP